MLSLFFLVLGRRCLCLGLVCLFGVVWCGDIGGIVVWLYRGCGDVEGVGMYVCILRDYIFRVLDWIGLDYVLDPSLFLRGGKGYERGN